MRSLRGLVKAVRVVTNRGEGKAVWLAATGFGRPRDVLDVVVRDDGPPETDPQGLPVLRGYAFDRDEW